MSRMENGDCKLDEHEAGVVRHFDERREFYESVTGIGDLHAALYTGEMPRDRERQLMSSSPEFQLRMRRRMTDAVTEPAAVGKDDRVLDAGCGYGRTALYLAGKYGCKVTGVNIDPRQIELAREKAAAEGLAEQVEFLPMNCSHPLTFGSETFDVVVNMESACYYSNRDLFLREVGRVLRPGGRFVTEDYMAADELSAENYRKFVEPFCRAWALHSLESEASYTRKLKEVGLELVEFAGFDGADELGLNVLENKHMATTKALFGGAPVSQVRPWHDMWGTHALAWRGGHICLKRFLARKP